MIDKNTIEDIYFYSSNYSGGTGERELMRPQLNWLATIAGAHSNDVLNIPTLKEQRLKIATEKRAKILRRVVYPFHWRSRFTAQTPELSDSVHQIQAFY
jgi:hypothetical protein